MSRKKQEKVNENIHYKIYILVDGECEKKYIQYVKNHFLERNQNKKITIFPEIPSYKSIKSCSDYLQNATNDYQKVIWIVDYDKVYSDKKIQEFLQVYNSLESEVIILINNPCLEFWFLLHYVKTDCHYLNFDQLKTELRKYMPGYDKKQKNFEKVCDELFKNNKLLTAIQNAKSIASDLNNIQARADIYKIFENDCSLLKESNV